MGNDNYIITMDSQKNPGRTALIVGIIFMLISAAGFFVDRTQFFLTYLTGYMFWLSIALGALFFNMVHHLTGASWSTVVRRITENAASVMPLMILLFIPVILGISDLFHWSHPEVMDPASDQYDHILHGKHGYLNLTFFIIRSVFYFAVWTVLAWSLRKKSIEQDNGHTEKIGSSFTKISAPGIILFAVTITFASYDWLMSLDAHWFSTIFGVYIFSGAFLAYMCFLILAVKYMKNKNILNGIITPEHYQDISKIIFAFVIFWAYMAFSQYFLIWYANLPEENYWFLYRWENSWKYLSLVLIFGHFVFPFIALITRWGKRSLNYLLGITVWLLLMRFVDLYWLVLPSQHRDGMHFTFFDLAPLIGIGGLFIFCFQRRQASSPLIPKGDPKLKDSIEFLNS